MSALEYLRLLVLRDELTVVLDELQQQFEEAYVWWDNMTAIAALVAASKVRSELEEIEQNLLWEAILDTQQE